MGLWLFLTTGSWDGQKQASVNHEGVLKEDSEPPLLEDWWDAEEDERLRKEDVDTDELSEEAFDDEDIDEEDGFEDEFDDDTFSDEFDLDQLVSESEPSFNELDAEFSKQSMQRACERLYEQQVHSQERLTRQRSKTHPTGHATEKQPEPVFDRFRDCTPYQRQTGFNLSNDEWYDFDRLDIALHALLEDLRGFIHKRDEAGFYYEEDQSLIKDVQGLANLLNGHCCNSMEFRENPVISVLKTERDYLTDRIKKLDDELNALCDEVNRNKRDAHIGRVGHSVALGVADEYHDRINAFINTSAIYDQAIDSLDWMPNHLKRIFTDNGIDTLRELALKTWSEVLEISGVGPIRAQEILDVMDDSGVLHHLFIHSNMVSKEACEVAVHWHKVTVIRRQSDYQWRLPKALHDYGEALEFEVNEQGKSYLKKV